MIDRILDVCGRCFLNRWKSLLALVLIGPVLIGISFAQGNRHGAADFNRSGRVDYEDLLEFIQYWHGTAHVKFDMTNDLRIDRGDLMRFFEAFHQEVEPPLLTPDLHYGEAVVGKVGHDFSSVYTFVGSASDTFSIVVDALGPLNAMAELISPASEVLETFGTATTTSRDAVLEEYTIVDSGTHTIRISSVDGAVGFYGLGLSDRPIDTPVAIQEGQAVSANLTPLADDDLFQFQGVTGQIVRVIAERESSLTTSLSIGLYDPSGGLVAEAVDFSLGTTGGDANNAALETTLTSDGTYTILVDSENGPGGGGYSVSIYFVDDVGQAITAEVQIEGEIDRGDYADYRFTALEGRYISAALDLIGTWEASLQLIQLGTGGAETVLIEEDSAGKYRLDEKGNTTVTRIPADGEYIIRVKSNDKYGGAHAGRFILYVSDHDQAPEPIEYGDVIEGEIYPIADDDVFTFQGNASDRVRIVGIRRGLNRGRLLRATLYGPDHQLVVMNIPSTKAQNPSERGYAADAGGILLEATLQQTGTYTMVLDARDIYGTSAYKLWIFNGEITREPLTPGQIVYGSLGHLDIKEYEFTAQADDIISIQLDALEDEFSSDFPGSLVTDWSADLVVIDMSNPFDPKTVISATARDDTVYEETARLKNTGTHVMRIFANRDVDYTTVGDFILYVSDWDETHAPTPLVEGVEVSGELTPIADDDFFSFTGSVGDQIRILGRVNDPSRDPQLRGNLYGPPLSAVVATGARLSGENNGFEIFKELTAPGEYLLMMDLDYRTNFKTGNYRVMMAKDEYITDVIQPGDIVVGSVGQSEIVVYEFDATANAFVSLWVDALGTPDGLRGTDPLGKLDLSVKIYDKNNLLGGPIAIPSDVGGGRNDYRLDNWRVPTTSTYQLVLQQEVLGTTRNAVGSFLLYLSDYDETPSVLTANEPQLAVLDPFVDDDLYQFDASAGEIITIRVERPGSTLTSELRATLFGPGLSGSVVSTGTTLTQPANLADTGGAGIDNLTLSAAGTYYILVDEEGPSSFTNDTSPGRGVYQITLNPVGVPVGPDEDNGGASPVTITPGASLAGRIDSVNDTDSYEFTLSAEEAGNPISIFVQGHLRAGIGEDIKPRVSLLSGATELVSGIQSNSDVRIDDYMLTSAGTYTIKISADVPTKGVYGLGVSDLPSETPQAMEAGGFIAAAIERLGDEDEYTFSATAGDQVDASLLRSEESGPFKLNSTVTLLDPSGTSLQVSSAASSPALLGAEIPTTGEYRLRVESDDASAGNYLFEMNVAPAVPAATSIAFGEERLGSLTASAEQAWFTFEVTANEQNKSASIIVYGLSLNTFLQLKDPGGTIIAAGVENGNDAILDDVLLDQLGTYTLIVTSNGTDRSGRFRIGLSDLPVETPSTVELGNPIGLDIRPLADEDQYAFSGGAGQKIDISVDTEVGNIGRRLDSAVTLLAPDGTVVAEDLGGLNSDLAGIVLPITGEYAIRVEPSTILQIGGSYEGTYTLLVTEIATPASATATIAFGQELPGALVTAEDSDAYVFSVTQATLGKTVSIAVAGDTLNADLILTRPDGSQVAALQPGRDAFIDDALLDQGGDYRLTVSGNSADPVGEYRIGVSDLPIEASGTIEVGETLVGTIFPLADEDEFIFDNTGTAIDVIVTTAEDLAQQVDADLSIFSPQGDLIAQNNAGYSPSISGLTLAATGAHRIRVEPSGISTGGYRLYLRHASVESASQAIAFGQEIDGELLAEEGADVYEFYVDKVYTGEKASIIAIGNTVDTDLRLFDPSGDLVALYNSGKHSLIDDFVLSSTGTWQIQISGGSSDPVGDYLIGLSDAPIETPETLQTVGRAFDYVGDEDLYTFESILTPFALSVTALDPTSMDIDITIFSPSGRIVAESIQFANSSEGRDGNSFSHTGVIERIVSEEVGDYTVLVEPGKGFLSNGVVKGSYSLDVAPMTVAPVGVAGVYIEGGTDLVDSLSGTQAFRDYVLDRKVGDSISAKAFSSALKLRMTLYPPFGGESETSKLVGAEANSPGDTKIAFDDLRAPADGEYTIRVFNLSGVLGEYSLSISNGRLADATAVVPGATAAGGLLPVSDDDYYTFEGQAGDVVQAGWTRPGGPGGLRGRLYDPNGRLLLIQNRPQGRIDANGVSFELELPVSGTYLAQVDSQEGERTAPAEATAEFSLLKRNVTTTAMVPAVTSQATIDRIDQAVFTFTGGEGDLISIEVVPDLTVPTDMGPHRVALDPDMDLISPSGETLLQDLDKGNTRATRFDDVILPLTGEYQVIVFPNGAFNTRDHPDSAGDFEIYFSDGPVEVATALVVDSSVEGDLDPIADDDFFTFNGIGGESYQITVIRANTSLPEVDLNLFNPEMQLIATGSYYSAPTDTRGRVIFTTLPVDGVYTVHLDVTDNASALQAPSSYILSLSQREEKTQAINPGESVSDTLGPVDIHRYTLNGSAGDLVSFEAAPGSGSLNVDLELYSPFGTVLQTSSNSVSVYTARLDDVILPVDGQYELWVFANGRGTGSTTSGPYTLYVSDGPSETPTALTAGVYANDSLASAADDDLYTISGTLGQTVEIIVVRQDQLNGKPLALKVFDPNGILLGESTNASSDTGGGELSLEFTVNGEHRVLIDSENVAETSDYSLVYN